MFGRVNGLPGRWWVPSHCKFLNRWQKTWQWYVEDLRIRCSWNSLVVPRLGICMPKRRKWVRLLVQDDSTCCGETKPMCHNYWSPCAWSPCSASREAATVRSLLTQPEKAVSSSKDPGQPSINKWIKMKRKSTRCSLKFLLALWLNYNYSL